MSDRRDLRIELGADWTEVVAWTSGAPPVDLAGATGRLQIRSEVGGPIILDASADLSIGASSVSLAVTGAVTGGLDAGVGIYDLFLTTAGGQDYRVMHGVVTMEARVSQ